MTLTIRQDPTTMRYVLMYNASLHKDSNCLRKVWFTAFEGLTQEAKDFKMEYGTAYHKAMKVHYSGGTDEEAVQAAIEHYSNVEAGDDWRSLGHLVACLTQYFNYYKTDLLRADVAGDGKHFLELTFAVPFHQTSLVDVLLCGTIDMRGRYMGQRVIVDHKTTSLSQVDSYLASYRCSPQLMMYKFIHEKLFPGEPVQCLINGIFLNRTSKNSFKRSDIINFTTNQMQNFELHLLKRIKAVVESFEKYLEVGKGLEFGMFTPNYTCCEEKFGSCQFLPLCLAETEGDAESLKSANFVNRVYDPLAFQA